MTQLAFPDPDDDWGDEVTSPQAQAHREATPTEQAAQRKIAPVAGKIRGNALLAIVAAGDRGLTVTEALAVLDMPERRRYSLAPRFTELKQGGYVVDHVAPARDGGGAFTATGKGRAWARENA